MRVGVVVSPAFARMRLTIPEYQLPEGPTAECCPGRCPLPAVVGAFSASPCAFVEIGQGLVRRDVIRFLVQSAEQPTLADVL